MSRWFRWYEGTSEDVKFRAVARHADVTVVTVIAVWAVLLEDASRGEPRGVATRGEPFYCAALDMDEPKMIAVLGAMEEFDLISVGNHAITIKHWRERQFETDIKDPTAAERKRRQRDKDGHKTANGSGTARHVGVTARHGDGTVATLPDTDTDTDTETDRKQIKERGIEISEIQKETNGAVLSETLSALVKRAAKKVDRSAYVWLKPTDTRVDRAQKWWRENYGSELPVQHEGTKQGYRVPWAAVR